MQRQGRRHRQKQTGSFWNVDLEKMEKVSCMDK